MEHRERSNFFFRLGYPWPESIINRLARVPRRCHHSLTSLFCFRHGYVSSIGYHKIVQYNNVGKHTRKKMEKKKIKKSNKFKFVLKTSETILSLLLIIFLHVYPYDTIPYCTKLYYSRLYYIISNHSIWNYSILCTKYHTIPSYINIIFYVIL